jgi:phage-related tail fiber protein
VLVKNQTTGSENGIYVSAAGAWSRSSDADTSAEVTSGMLVYVEGGTVSGGLVYILSTTGTITLGSTSLTFTAVVLPFSFFVGSTVAGTSYTTVLTDSGKRLNLTNASTKTITVPPQLVGSLCRQHRNRGVQCWRGCGDNRPRLRCNDQCSEAGRSRSASTAMPS